MPKSLNPIILALALTSLICVGCASLDLNSSSITNPSSDDPLDSRFALARLSERRNETDKARNIYEEVLKSQPQNTYAIYRLGVMAAKQGKYTQAHDYFDKALALGTPSAELYNDIGYCYFLQDQLPQAEKLFAKAVELDPEYKPAWTNLGLTLGQQERFKESRAAFAKATNLPAEVHCNMAYVYVQLFKFDLAQSEYRAALSLDPNLRIAADGLLETSKQIPGQEPVIVASTFGAEKKVPELITPADAGMEKSDFLPQPEFITNSPVQEFQQTTSAPPRQGSLQK